MKRILYLVAASLLVLAAMSCSRYKYETVAGDPLETKIYTLDNGLKIYMNVNRQEPRIQTYIAVRVGGKNDPAETTGLAHYFEHLMFKGTSNFGTSDYQAEKPMLDEIEALFETYRKTVDEDERASIYKRIDSISYEASKIAIPNEYDKLMALIGASGTNAFTSQDMTVYVENIPSNQTDNWARIQADRFKNPVIRGFHTELETIYEEKNMSLTNDSRKVSETLDAALFPHHPYGTQTVLGTQEHLKNPSITNVKNYHKTYYVPNNMAICLSGDFDPDAMVATIEKYFGDMQPNPQLPKLEFEKEAPITSPIVREVYGLEAENVTIAWPLPGACSEDNYINNVISMILYNGQAGIIDLDVIQKQELLMAYGYASAQPDYGSFVLYGRPKAGQSLEEVRDILLAQAEKLRNGDFDSTLVESSVNNIKLQMMQIPESTDDAAMTYVMSFINGEDWKDNVAYLDKIESITKEDIVAYANKYLRPEGYAIVYKRQGEDKSIQKIAAPKITPIVTNRDNQSEFLKEIAATPVKPIEPVFTDYSKELSVFPEREGVEVVYKQNSSNDLFTLSYVFDCGTENDPALNLAFNYLSYLGTSTRSYDDIAKELYRNACSFSMSSGSVKSFITVSGLSENMYKVMDIVEDLLTDAQPDEQILANLKNDMLQSRMNAKLSQGSCMGALQRYLVYGPEFISRTTLSNDALMALTSEQLLAKVREFRGKQHEIIYYGPMGKEELLASLKEHHPTEQTLQPLEKQYSKPLPTDKSHVYLAQYDAKQLYYIQYSNRGEKFDLDATAGLRLYNEYFGGGMNSIVFQEMREARGLAYTAMAGLQSPSDLETPYTFVAFIATQNDKMKQAIEAFDEIINQMPESEAAFDIAKEAIISNIRTTRLVRDEILWSYLSDREKGLKEPDLRTIYENIQPMTLADVKAVQEKWVKGRTYDYAILGDIKDLDMDYLKTLGEVRILSLEEIFGY